MPQNVDLQEMRRLVDEEQAQLVEVLPRDDYDVEHIPGAINVPLKELNERGVASLHRERAVITYCNDYQ